MRFSSLTIFFLSISFTIVALADETAGPTCARAKNGVLSEQVDYAARKIAETTASSCTVACAGNVVGGVADVRLKMGSPDRTYRFELIGKEVGWRDELYIQMGEDHTSVLPIHQAALEDAFTVIKQDLNVCSRLRGTRGSCLWSCAVNETQQQVIMKVRDGLSATFHYTCL